MKKENQKALNSISARKRKRKLFLSILMILFTGIVLTMGTYAWFSANKTVTVDSIDVNVSSSNGIQVSTDAINWKTVISNEDIIGASADDKYPTAVNQLPKGINSLSPVSTVGDITSTTGFMSMFSGEIDSTSTGDYILTAKSVTEQNGTSGEYIAFDLFFQVKAETQMYLTNKSNVIAGSTNSGIQNAARVAFLDEGTLTAGSTVSDIQALKGATSSSVVIWEPNYDVHTASAISNASSNYGINDLTQTGAARLEYNGVKAAIPADAEIPLASASTTYFSKVTPAITTVASGISSDSYESAFTLKAGITKMRIYMWIEGQDVDCENNASGGSLTFNLQFSSSSSASDVS